MKSTVVSLLLLVAVSAFACAPPPPNLSPQAISAFNKTRVIKGLDLLRDTAIDASTPPSTLLSIDTTRKVVQAHESLLKILESTNAGWNTTIRVTLDALLTNSPPKEANLMRPYVALVEVILAEVQ